MFNQKQIIAFIGLGVFIILYVIFVFPLAEEVGRYLSSKSPVKFFIMTLILSLLLIAVRVLKNNYKKYQKTGDLAEWFAMLFTPIPSAIEAIKYTEISLYWIYFPYVISSVFWISIGVYKGGLPMRGWDVGYQNAFIVGCVILFAIGIVLHINFDMMYPYFQSRFFPWLSE